MGEIFSPYEWQRVIFHKISSDSAAKQQTRNFTPLVLDPICGSSVLAVILVTILYIRPEFSGTSENDNPVSIGWYRCPVVINDHAQRLRAGLNMEGIGTVQYSLPQHILQHQCET